MPRETKEQRRKRARRLLGRLERLYPEADCELEHRSPYELLISTILSAQTTDKAVNRVTPELFRRYPTTERLALADTEAVESLISSIGLYRNKAKAIVGAAREIVTRFGGHVPDDREGLESLPGVGRKTANVVLPNAFGVPGLAVDTHVARLSRRLGLSRETDPKKIEQDLTALFSPRRWGFVSHALIWHGRRVCDARRPRCEACRLADACPSAGAADAAPARRRAKGARTASRRMGSARRETGRSR
ncbi:MAG: endonuclease III [Acidobacteriota bacterium]|nr:endonuclease III [Acidobacteriota bacterium]